MSWVFHTVLCARVMRKNVFGKGMTPWDEDSHMGEDNFEGYSTLEVTMVKEAPSSYVTRLNLLDNIPVFCSLRDD